MAETLFYADEQHTQRDRGVLTGEVHRSACGAYIGHELLVRGRLVSVPHWRFLPAGHGAAFQIAQYDADLYKARRARVAKKGGLR